MSHPRATAGHRAVAIVFLAISSVILLMATLGLIPRIFGAFGQNWTGRADLFTPRVPFIDLWAEIGKDNGDAYAGLIFSSAAPLVESRWLTAAESALDSLVIIVGCLLVVIMAIRILMLRGLGRVTRWGLVVLGLLITLDATLGPQLPLLASDIALQQLGYPIFDPTDPVAMTENSPESVILTSWDPQWIMNRFDFALLMLGMVVILFGVFARAPRGASAG